MTKPFNDAERKIAEVTASLIARAHEEEQHASPYALGIPDHALYLLARAHIELLDQVRAQAAVAPFPRLVLTQQQLNDLSGDDLLKLYCEVMNELSAIFVKHETYVVRQWDGMDGCWTDCTEEVGREEALRDWARRTDGGTRRVAFVEIDYYKIFPGGTRMHWDGSEGRELHR